MPTSFCDHYGPWALVTGAARGLGAAFCWELAGRGLPVLALDRDADALASLVDSLRQAGAEAEALVLDLASRPEAITIELDRALAGRELGLLINNAALMHTRPFFSAAPEDMLRLQRVNCDAALVLTRHLGPAMLERGRGGIVIVSSLSSLQGGPLIGHYAATKAYGAILAESLHEELRGTGVHVTTLLGPLMDTPGFQATEAAGTLPDLVDPRRAARAALEGLGRRARVIVGRDGHICTAALWRMLPHAWTRRITAHFIRRMYPDR